MAQFNSPKRRNPFTNPQETTTPRRGQRSSNGFNSPFWRDTGKMNPPSPSRTPPYRYGTPPPATFHSPTHHSPTHSSPTYSQTAIPPVPNISSLRRGPNHNPVAIGNKAGASPFTQISAEYQETMQQIGRSSIPGQPRSISPPNPLPPSLERRNSGSSKRSSISPRHSFSNSTSATSLVEQLKSIDLSRPSGGTPPPRMHSPRVQSPLHETHSPKRRTPDRSLPLNEETEEHQEQGRRGEQHDPDFDSPDTRSPGEDADATIKPIRRLSTLDRTSPLKPALTAAKSRERLQERYQRSLEAATQETPVQRLDDLHDSDEDETSDYGEDMNGRESRAGHREDDPDLLDGVPDPNAGALHTIPEILDAEDNVADEHQDEPEEEMSEEPGQATPKSPTTTLLESPLLQQATQLAANQIMAQLFPNRLSQLRMQENSQQARARRDSTTSTGSQRPPMPVRQHIPEVAVPTASQHWSPDVAFDPRDVNRLLRDLQRNISPLSQSRYSRANQQHQQQQQSHHPLQQSFGEQGLHQQETLNAQMLAATSDLLGDPQEAMMIGSPGAVPEDLIQSLMGDTGYYGYAMGMVSPAPSTAVDPNLYSAQTVAGNSLAAMANAIASSNGVTSPQPQRVRGTNIQQATAQKPETTRSHRGQQDMHSEVTNENDRERPGAPIPPTPYTNQISTAASTPGPGQATQLPIESQQMANLVTHAGLLSPQTHPAPYGHMRRHQTFPIHPQHPPQFMRGMSYPDQYQYQNFQGGPVLTDSTFSPAATPYPHPVYPYNPFIQQNLQAVRAGDRANIPIPPHLLETMSMRSSPSHLPVLLPPEASGPRRLRRKTKMNNQTSQVNGAAESEIEQGFSTEPLETSPDHTEAGEATDYGLLIPSQILSGMNEEQPLIDLLNDRDDQTTPVGIAIGGEEDDDEDEWIDEDDGAEGELLGLEYHPSYIMNAERRKRKWEHKWEVMKEAASFRVLVDLYGLTIFSSQFQTIDRETDSTMLLLAAPSHTNTLHTLSSRSLRRSPALMLSSEISNVRTNFSKVAASRRRARAQTASLLERLRGGRASVVSSTPSEAAEAREEELKFALEGALGSLSQLGKMYHDLQTRWQTEMVRLGEERESIQLLLQQAFGAGVASSLPHLQQT